MTRKHYETIAASLASNRPLLTETRERTLWEMMVSDLASVLAADNERFNRDRFLCACREGA